jgi:hypothetical protein
MAGPVRAATHVVDQTAPRAADTNPGTEEKPFKTVQHAADAAKPGDTVCVMAGKYDERVRVKAGGTGGQPITFRAMPRRSATVSGFDLQASYLRIEGFDITAARPAVAVQLDGSHCEVLDNYIHEMLMGVNGTYGRSVAGGPRDYSAVAHIRVAYNKVYHSEYGFVVGGEDWLVENNEVRRLFMYSPGNRNDDCDYTRFFGKGCVQRYNYYHGTVTSEIKVAHVDCIQTFMGQDSIAQDVLFEHNTCFDWGQGAMIESQPNIGSVRNWTWRHNIYSSKLPTYRGAWGLDVIQTLDVTVENNTFAGIPWCGVGLRGKESSNGQIRNNLFYDMQQAVLDGNKDDFTPANPGDRVQPGVQDRAAGDGQEHQRQGPVVGGCGEAGFPFAEGQPGRRGRQGRRDDRRSGVSQRVLRRSSSPGCHGRTGVGLSGRAAGQPGQGGCDRPAGGNDGAAGRSLSRGPGPGKRWCDGPRHEGREGDHQRGGPHRRLEARGGWQLVGTPDC